MQKKTFIAALLSCAIAAPVALAAPDQTSNQTQTRSAENTNAKGQKNAPTFKWTAAGGEVDVVKGTIDKWDDKGRLEAGGFLGMGDTKMRVTSETLIVGQDGRRLNRADLRPGRGIATIFKKIDAAAAKTNDKEASTNKVALVIVIEQ